MRQSVSLAQDYKVRAHVAAQVKHEGMHFIIVR